MSRELPIFPLPLVLFPGTTQPLHVFEPRYRRLLADCLAGDKRFGIAYHRAAAGEGGEGEGGAGGGATEAAPVPGVIGCVAVIRSTTALPDGRANILTAGERRFTLVEWVPSPLPYRVAHVEEFDDEPVDETEAAALAAEVRQDFGRLTRALAVLTDRDDQETELSTEPLLLSFQVAAALELEPDAKQALLTLRNTADRLRRLAALLVPLSADAERRAVVRQRARGNGRGGAHPQIEPAA
ncbi:MAG: ATP-dependent protease [Gemmatimonadetes bacterium]|nr:MAG: ATP-dependent protease [Gemmatimonadota bacterium]